jgi:hypothetical protein
MMPYRSRNRAESDQEELRTASCLARGERAPSIQFLARLYQLRAHMKLEHSVGNMLRSQVLFLPIGYHDGFSARRLVVGIAGRC